MQMSPAKMLVAKVVSHRDLDRRVVLALEEFGLLEFIDVRRQAGIIQVKKTPEEQSVYSALDRLSRMIGSLELNRSQRKGTRIEYDDAELETSLARIGEVITAVEAEIIEIDQNTAVASLELERQKGIRDVAVSLEPLGLDPSLIGTTEFTFTTAGVLPSGNVSRLEWSIVEVTERAFAFKSIQLKRGVAVCSLTVPVDLKDAVQRILSALGFESFEITEESEGKPHVIESLATTRIAELESELETLSDRRESIANEWGSRILSSWEAMEIECTRIEARSFFVYTEHSVKLWGWIPDGTQEKLETLLRGRAGSALEVTFDHPDFADLDSPTYLDNPSIMKPTEDVVKAFGVPSKHDLDPTKIQWLSFPLIFGLIFADVGQGFLVLLIGLFALRAKRKGDDWGEILGYIQSGAQGLIMMGIFAMLGGFLFGSFFGAETVVEPLWPIFAHSINGEHNAYRTIHMLKLSIEIGAIHISLGIFLSLYNKLKHREYREAVVSLSYLWLYLGFVNLLFGVSYSNINAWFSSSGTVNLWLPIVGIGAGTGNNGIYPLLPLTPLVFTIVAFVLPFIIMTVTSFMGKMDGVVHFLESAIGMVSHTVSYARIFALNMVHMILSSIFMVNLPAIITIPFARTVVFGVELIPEGAYLPLLGAIIGSLLVGLLEGLLGFMHTLRLHMVEWYSKFYHAGGTEFKPFSIKRLHTVSVVPAEVATNYPVS